MCCAILHSVQMAVVFPFNIPCYAVALLPTTAHDPACLLSLPACLTALLLFHQPAKLTLERRRFGFVTGNDELFQRRSDFTS